MARIVKRSLVGLLVLAGVIQIVRPSRTNPPVNPAHEIASVHPATRDVAGILQRSCNDCHSNRTVWPWYSNVAPASWLVAHDVNDGRDALNFSTWVTYDPEKRQELLGKVCEEARDGEMPVFQYALAHPRARLTRADVQALCSWTGQVAANSGAKEESD